MLKLSLAIAIATSAGTASAYSNRCTEKSYLHSRVSLCPGVGYLDSGKVRNISGQRIECSTSLTSDMVRRQDDFDLDQWSDLLNQNRKEAFAYRRQFKAPSYEGSIPFKTVEAWQWESCDLVTNALHCGTDEVCSNERREEGRERVCNHVPRTCYADIVHYESAPCTDENLPFKLEFLKPGIQEWNPTLPEFDDAIPNKYDLLPGEIEKLRLYINESSFFSSYMQGFSDSVNFRLGMDGARNEYVANGKFRNGSLTTACRVGFEDFLHVKVSTQKRIKTRTPNNLVPAETWDGARQDAIEWQSVQTPGGTYVEHAIPRKVNVAEASAAFVNLLSEQSRREAKAPFYKNTKMRIRLYERRWWWSDLYVNQIYVDGSEAILASLAHLSENRTHAHGDTWQIELLGAGAGKNIFTAENSYFFGLLYGSPIFEHHLRPGRKYVLKLAVYQPGVSFYNQSCEDDDSPLSCRWKVLGLFKPREESYYSEDIELEFVAPSAVDLRSRWEKFRDGAKLYDTLLNWFS